MINLAKITTIYGPPGVAKTAFAINYAIYNNQTPVIYLTSEMSTEELYKRAVLIVNDINSDKYNNSPLSDQSAYDNVMKTKTSHITIINNKEGNVSFDFLKDCVLQSKTSGAEKVIVIIDSFTVWEESLSDTQDNILAKLLELQEDTNASLLIICQENKNSSSIMHFSDQVIKFTFERGGKTIGGKKYVKLFTEKDRFKEPSTSIIPFAGDEQKFYF